MATQWDWITDSTAVFTPDPPPQLAQDSMTVEPYIFPLPPEALEKGPGPTMPIPPGPTHGQPTPPASGVLPSPGPQTPPMGPYGPSQGP